MSVCVLLVLHIATIDTQSPSLIGPPAVGHVTHPAWSDAWKIEDLSGMSLSKDSVRLAFQSLAPAGGSQLGSTGYMSRSKEPTFGAGSSYTARRQQRSRYNQAQRSYQFPTYGGYGGYGRYGGFGRYGGYGFVGEPKTNRHW
ncbi:hypothetical protein Mal52_41990 [Symmachiella dynata]|uniref:Uncharacterized protein n=1 Tax=Symmachiella dynata TaxID=2527995 RepID=A0A517ZTC4_9PLAN|nr:hypothetical protein [Symmachiella dynata]QDU45704.1 hypothetical protein Mal52_41990 [Symmachiella dynata]